MEFETRIQGIPCIIEVTYYTPGTNFQITSASLEPNDPEEFEFRVLDRKGYPARWLERKMTDGDEDQVYREFKESQKEVY